MGVPSNVTARELFSPWAPGSRSRRLAALRTQNRLAYPIGGGATVSSARPFYMGRSVAEVAMDQRQLRDDLPHEGGQRLVMRVHDALGGVVFEWDRDLV